MPWALRTQRLDNLGAFITDVQDLPWLPGYRDLLACALFREPISLGILQALRGHRDNTIFHSQTATGWVPRRRRACQN
jgi:hypothetical protein